MRLLTTAFALAMVAVALAPGCKDKKQRPVSVIGSTSIQPFAELLAQEYQKSRPQAAVDVQGGGSTAGLLALVSGIADIGMCSRSLNSDEATQFTAITIARDGLAVVVHPGNGVSGLTLEQIRDLFSGKVANWKQVGGKDGPVRPIVREEGSGTREAFTKLLMGKDRVSTKALVQESNGAVKELIKHDPGAIGYMSLGLVGGELKALVIDGVAPTGQTVLDGRYKLVRPFLFVTNGKLSTQAEAYVEFVLSPQGQRLLEEEGLVRIK